MTRVIDFPDGWGTAPPIDTLVYDRNGLKVAGVLLADGTNMFVLIYGRGQRFARTALSIDWGIEEAFTGIPPAAHEKDAVDEAWRYVIGEMVSASRATDAEMVRAGLPTGQEIARMLRERQEDGSDG